MGNCQIRQNKVRTPFGGEYSSNSISPALFPHKPGKLFNACRNPGYATAYDEYSWPSPFISTVPSHTGDTIDNTYIPYYANVGYECTHIDYGHGHEPRYFEVWDAVRDSFVPFIIKNALTRYVIYEDYPDRCLVWSGESTREIHDIYQQFSSFGSHEVWTTFTLWSPFEAAGWRQFDFYHNEHGNVGYGWLIQNYKIFCQSHYSSEDMLGYIIVDFDIFDQGTEAFHDRFEDLPYCAFYTTLDINPTAPPNPFTDLVHDSNLSDLVSVYGTESDRSAEVEIPFDKGEVSYPFPVAAPTILTIQGRVE